MIKLEKSAYPSVQFHALLPETPPPGNHETFSVCEGNRTLISSSGSGNEAQGGLRFESKFPATDLPDRRGKFSDAERDNILCLLASPDGRFGSLELNGSAQVYTCLLGKEHRIVFPIKAEHHLWLIPQAGEIDLSGVRVAMGQAASVSDETGADLDRFGRQRVPAHRAVVTCSGSHSQ